MYKVKRDKESLAISRAFDELVLDIIDFTEQNSNIIKDGTDEDIQILLDELSKYNPKLGSIAAKSGLKKSIYNLKISPIKIKESYDYYTNGYLKIIDGCSLKSYLFDPLVRESFESFYKNTVSSKTFIEEYSAELKVENALKLIRKNSSLNKTCPYCNLHELEYDLTSVDHFLPKSYYPVLAIYSANLVVACTACNDRLKKNFISFPIMHPYFHNVSDYVTFYFDKSTRTIKELSIDENKVKSVENFLALFKITDRFNGKIKNLENDKEDLRRNVKKILLERRKHKKISEKDIEELLKEEYKDYLQKQLRGQGEYSLTKLKYDFMCYIINNEMKNEIEYLQSELKGFL